MHRWDLLALIATVAAWGQHEPHAVHDIEDERVFPKQPEHDPDKIYTTADVAPRRAKYAGTVDFDYHLDMHDPETVRKEQASHPHIRKRHYTPLPSVQYHKKLAGLGPNGPDGAIFAYVDETRKDYIAIEGALNRAAASFRCLFPGGVHVLKVNEDQRAGQIHKNFHEDHGDYVWMSEEQEHMELPFVAYFHAGDDFRAVPKSILTGRANWTVPILKTWAYSLINIAYLENEEHLMTLTHQLWNSNYGHLILGVFDRLCEDTPSTFLEAVVKQRVEADPLPVAVSTNRTLRALTRWPEMATYPGIFSFENDGSDPVFETSMKAKRYPLAGELDEERKEDLIHWLLKFDAMKAAVHDEL